MVSQNLYRNMRDWEKKEMINEKKKNLYYLKERHKIIYSMYREKKYIYIYRMSNNKWKKVLVYFYLIK